MMDTFFEVWPSALVPPHTLWILNRPPDSDRLALLAYLKLKHGLTPDAAEVQALRPYIQRIIQNIGPAPKKDFHDEL